MSARRSVRCRTTSDIGNATTIMKDEVYIASAGSSFEGEGERPALSIVIPTRNRVRYLERCLASVFSAIDNDYSNVEVIVIDGGSDDGSVDLLRKYAPRLAYWVSEPDSCIAEAINKGIARASGDVIRLIGDDDELVGGALSKMMAFISAHPDVDVLFGHNEVFIEDESGNLSYCPQEKLVGWVDYKAMLRFPFDGLIIPECAFFRRQTFAQCGAYDLRFRFWGYRELFLRMTRMGLRFFVLPELVVKTYQTPQSDSMTQNGSQRWNKEYYDVLWLQGNLYWVMWHKFGGEFNLFSPLKYLATRFFRMINFPPRKRFRQLKARVWARSQ
jgi:glycosyltransferase involved in cell wall biosynthesis